MFMIVAGTLIWWNLAYLPPGDFGDADDIEEATAVTHRAAVDRRAGDAFGLWACTQFWRSGEDIRTGESAT